jgi:uncharacterized protein YpmS
MKMKDKWKSLFFILLCINIAILGMLYYLLTSPIDSKPLDNKTDGANSVPFLIQTNKKDLNIVINQYLQNQSQGPIEYQISLDDYVNLFGTFPIFNQNIQMKVAFEPKALENGDLLLQEKEISVGRLQLPAATVLKFVNDRYQFPEWVTINPGKEQVYVDLQNMDLKSKLQVKVNEFDLKQDDIKFTLLLPIEKGVSR